MILLTATLLPSPLGNGDISVHIRTAVNGEDVCSVQLPSGTCDALADLEKVLCDPHGPMFGSYPWSHLLFYAEEEPLRPLDLNLQLDLFHSLLMKRGDMEALLDKLPEVGKFLEAMGSNKFDPSSPNFQVAWTAASAPTLLAAEAECMVHEVLSESPIHEDSGLHFVQIFGKLISLGEQWNYFNLALMQHFDPGLKTFKHCISQHWLVLARVAATPMISEAAPILLLLRGDKGFVIGCSVIGDAFPSNFGRNLQNSLRLLDVSPGFSWRQISQALLSLDWNPEEGRASLQHLREKIGQEPREFAALTDQEVSQMVQLQLRLSCCGVAEVKGPINESCVKMLAELLAYELQILKFQSVLDLKNQISDFKGTANHRGTLLLVTDLPASTPSISGWPHRMVLCYKAEEQICHVQPQSG